MSDRPLPALDGACLAAWAARARDELAAARAEIDDLNVYPVPDGDTGTNLHLTVCSAVDALAELREAAAAPDLADQAATLARGALLGARGNSGVILAQLLRGFADTVAGAAEPADPALVAAALQAAADAAYAAVATPVEGTILTVARAAADAAAKVVAETEPGDPLALQALVTAAADAASEALDRTPDLLPVLAAAGVVDAGGRGLCVLLDALAAVVTGTVPTHPPYARHTPAGDRPTVTTHTGPAFEVMYLLDAPAEAIPALRETLGGLGDSLLVVGGEPTWNVHVHVDDVGAAIEAGVEAGRPYRIRVTHFATEAARHGESAPATDGRGVVSVVAGAGLGALFESHGATVVPGGPGRRASTAELLDGIRRSGARDVVVLPNDQDSLAVAEAAAAQARQEGRRVAVIPTRASVQAIAALAVHDPARRFDDDVLAMSAAAGHCRHGGVTVAAKQAVTMAGVCAPGDVLGIVDGDFVLIGDELAAVACQVTERLLAGGGELVTLVTGDDEAAHELADAVVSHLRRTHPEVDANVFEGGQARYPLLIGVE